MDNTLNGSQSYTSAFKLVSPVKTLEYAKEFIDILHLKTNAIVSNENDYLIFFSIGASYLNLRLAGVCCVNLIALVIRLTNASRSIERSPYT